MKNEIQTILTEVKNRPQVLSATIKHQIMQCLDHTSLNQNDSESSIRSFVERSRDLDIAAICVYPSMIETAGISLGESDISICAVCGSFPSGQTYLEVKLLEIALAIENGADEIDVVIDLGAILDGEFDRAKSEIEAIKNEIDDDAILKVIIESGILTDEDLIYKAAMVAMDGGADFVKTSTGKEPIGATAEAVASICFAIRDFYNKSGKRVGIKVSGGVSTYEDALKYKQIVETILGSEYTNSKHFRIGSSKLALM